MEIESTKSENSNGLRWPPWGTPEVVSNVFEEESSLFNLFKILI